MKVKILTSALEDLADGRDFYERQANGVGNYFFDSLFADIDSLKMNGGIHLKVFDFHRLLATRFPYAIYYRIQNGVEVMVYRVLDCRQDPRKTKSALKNG